MRTEDWTKEEWEMTVQLERITAQNAEEKHQELSKRRKSERPRRTKKDWLRYAANLAAVAVLLYFLVNGTILFVFRALWTALEKGLSEEWKLQGEGIYRGIALAVPLLGLAAARLLLEQGVKETPMRLKPNQPWPEEKQIWLFVPAFMGLSVIGDMVTSVVRYGLEALTVYPPEQVVQLPENPLGVLYYFL